MRQSNSCRDLLEASKFKFGDHQKKFCCVVALFFGTRDLFYINYSRELYLFSKFLHFEEIVRVKMAVCFEMIVSET